MNRDELVRLLVERLRAHRPRFLTVPQTVAVIRRLICHALASESGCVLWNAAVNNSHYGLLNVRLAGAGHTRLCVHRLAWQFAHDARDIPAHMHVGHKCDTPPCFHPDHIGLERNTDNQRRSAENTNRKKARKRNEQREVALNG